MKKQSNFLSAASTRTKMSLTTSILSISLMLFLVAGSADISSFDASALKGKGVPNTTFGASSNVCGDKLCSEISNEMKSVSSESMKKVTPTKEIPVMTKQTNHSPTITETQQSQGVGLEFNVPETIIAKNLVPINARVFDTAQGANLSHTDWSYAVTNSDGDVIHKSTTLHGHFGVMNFKVNFPESGTYTISYSALSSGPFMLGLPIPELGQTRSVISGDLLKFEEDPKNNFGSRTFEFTVNVSDSEQIVIVDGSEPDTKYLVKLTTHPEKIVAGEPVTLVFDVDDYYTGKDATHVDGLITVIPQHYYHSDTGDQPEAPVVLHGAYHGHLGLMSITETFQKSGTVLMDAEFRTIPYSKPLFGQGSTQFVIQVFDSQGTQSVSMTSETTKKGVVDIVGIESPFYSPNTINVSAGETILFDNVDANYHTVTSVKSGTTEHDGKFDSGLLNAGESYELTLNESGTFDYFCSLHTGMKGTIIVS